MVIRRVERNDEESVRLLDEFNDELQQLQQESLHYGDHFMEVLTKL
jgi:hypothetical protein